MRKFDPIVLGNFISTLTDYHANGSYKTLKENVLIKNVPDYAVMIRTLNFERPDFESDLIYLNEKEYNYLKKTKVYPNDILMNKIANPGSVYLMPDLNMPVSLAMNLFLIRFNDEVNQVFMFYLMKTNEKYIKNFANGTTTLTITKDSVRGLGFNVPPKLYQDKIAKTLADLDKKIILNNKIDTELEAMAKLIYDYWFVQFDFPDANGKPYKSSGGKMVYNEALKREIPEGWEVGTLLDVANFTNGIACQKYRSGADEDYYNVIKIREMGAGFTENSERITRRIPKKVVVNNGDVLFSWSATLDVKIWAGGVGGLNQHIFKITSNDYPRTYYYFEILRYLQHFKMIAELRKTTMGHITQDHLKQSRISIAPNELVDRLHSVIDPIISKTVKAKEENQKLATLRDWLLPMLMNGQVTVKDV